MTPDYYDFILVHVIDYQERKKKGCVLYSLTCPTDLDQLKTKMSNFVKDFFIL